MRIVSEREREERRIKEGESDGRNSTGPLTFITSQQSRRLQK